MASLGHGRQLLREIANLGKTAGAAPSAPALPEQPIAAPIGTPPVEAAGERRHVTVMFCDLVDSTGTSVLGSTPRNGAVWLALISRLHRPR
jgi:hypothetical protein